MNPKDLKPGELYAVIGELCVFLSRDSLDRNWFLYLRNAGNYKSWLFDEEVVAYCEKVAA